MGKKEGIQGFVPANLHYFQKIALWPEQRHL